MGRQIAKDAKRLRNQGLAIQRQNQGLWQSSRPIPRKVVPGFDEVGGDTELGNIPKHRHDLLENVWIFSGNQDLKRVIHGHRDKGIRDKG
jgi:hypothetical protein